MKYLFDSHGHHVANEVNGQLHAPSGHNIGHFIKSSGIFIDMYGRYLGEIGHGNRLLSNRASPYRGTNFGSYGNYGNVGNFGNPGNYGSIGMIAVFADVDPGRLE